jgi:hypothetical protein
MPTQAELQDLINKTNYEWVNNFNGSGINGGKFTNKTNPNAYVFFPAAGYYLDGSLDGVGIRSYVWGSNNRNEMNFGQGLLSTSDGKYLYNDYRTRGFPVRGVHAAV